MASALRVVNPSSVEASPAIDDLVSRLGEGPVVVEANGEPVAVLVDVERFRDMEAIYQWHQQVLQERRAS